MILLLAIALQATISLAADVPPSPYYLSPANQADQRNQSQDQTNPNDNNTTQDSVPPRPSQSPNQGQSQQRTFPPPNPGAIASMTVAKAHLHPQLQRCLELGNIVSFTGNNLQALSAYQFKLHTDKMPTTITPINLSPNQIAFKIAESLSLSPSRTYDLHLIHTRSQRRHEQSPLKITLCSTDKNKQSGFTIQRERNQILAFSPIEQTELIIKKADQLGLKLSENKHLKNLEHDLLLFHGDEKALPSLIKQLQNHFQTVSFDFNHHYTSAATPRHYAAKMINWPETKSCKAGLSQQPFSIGLIDGLPDVTHPVLKDQTITIQSFINPRSTPDKQHGTAIAGILAGQQSHQNHQGLLTGVHIMSAVALRHENQKSLATTDSIVRAINWLLSHHVRLVNISLAGKKNNIILEKTIAHANKNNMIIFAAAGNEGSMTEQPSYPAALPDVFAITAIDAAHRLYQHANQGSYIDFAAPGVDIWTISQTGQGKYRSGTSYAAPYAIAIAALYLMKNETMSRDEIHAALKKNAHSLIKDERNNRFGWGIIRASKELCLDKKQITDID